MIKYRFSFIARVYQARIYENELDLKKELENDHKREAIKSNFSKSNLFMGEQLSKDGSKFIINKHYITK